MFSQKVQIVSKVHYKPISTFGVLDHVLYCISNLYAVIYKQTVKIFVNYKYLSYFYLLTFNVMLL